MKSRKPLTTLLHLLALPLVFAACTVSSWSTPSIVGSGKIIKATPPVASIKQVDITAVGVLDITQGPADSLEIEADDNIMPLIETRMDGDRLYLGLKSNTNVQDATIRYHLVVQDLNAISISGAAEAKMETFKTARLALDISGAGKMHAGKLDAPALNLNISGAGKLVMKEVTADTIKVNLSGAGNVELAGATRRQELDVSGGSRYFAPLLLTRDSNVSVSGAGNARIACDGPLMASASGAGNVTYSGTARVTKSTNGAGVVEKD